MKAQKHLTAMKCIIIMTNAEDMSPWSAIVSLHSLLVYYSVQLSLTRKVSLLPKIER